VAAFSVAFFTTFLARCQGEAEAMYKHLEPEAIEALRETLRQISVIKVKDICVDRHSHRSDKTILCHIEIYGHAHLLACKLVSACDPPHLNRAVRELQKAEKVRGVVVKRILISPAMSEEAQTLCRDNDIGFLDLDGNARIYLDEVFIVKRSLHQKRIPPPAETLPNSETARFAQVA
jgi:DNA-directed RNA polymerase subunit F